MNLENLISKYYSSIFKCSLYGTLPLSIWICLAANISDILLKEASVFSLGASFSLIFIVLEAILLLCIFVYTVGVYENGIYGYNFSMRKKAQWADMKVVKSARYFGVPYVQIKSDDNKALLYIPLGWLSNEIQFRDDVIEQAGEDHPLSQFYLGLHN